MSSIIHWRPSGQLSSLPTEMNQVFERFFGPDWDTEAPAPSAWLPATNVSETEDSFVVVAEIPGLEPKDIDISLTGDMLTVKGEKKQEKEEKNQRWHRSERTYGSFTRAFRLPASVVADKVSADYKNGVVRITLPKTDESRRREVKIQIS